MVRMGEYSQVRTDMFSWARDITVMRDVQFCQRMVNNCVNSAAAPALPMVLHKYFPFVSRPFGIDYERPLCPTPGRSTLVRIRYNFSVLCNAHIAYPFSPPIQSLHNMHDVQIQAHCIISYIFCFIIDLEAQFINSRGFGMILTLRLYPLPRSRLIRATVARIGQI
jgi:hypothetical protein